MKLKLIASIIAVAVVGGGTAVYLSTKTSTTDIEPPAATVTKPQAAPTPITLSTESGVCAEEGSGVNLQAILEKNCKRLSSYRLFQESTNPTKGGNDRVVPYDLTSPLFTDYASKYRFVYVPEGLVANYSDKEAMDFPVGTVLIKTFSLPENTNNRGFENERLIETRLLIHRENGWTALPYIWTADSSDAALKVAGGQFDVSLVHNGETLSFKYLVPDKNKCKQCHQTDVPDLETGETVSIFSPIGPKARLLNMPYNYAHGTQNQLTYWQDQGLLENVPADLASIKTIPGFHDEDVNTLSMLSQDELQDLAKGYLDINCSHCHREDGGNASNTGLSFEYWRSYEGNEKAHGRCKTPIAFSDEVNDTRPYGLKPGSSAESLMIYRMETLQPGHRMPEIGRMTKHTEGVELITRWIDSLEAEECAG